MSVTAGPWKCWNGWGPYEHDGLMRAERIGPDGGGGIRAGDGPDMIGSREDFELAAAAPDLLQACKETMAYWDSLGFSTCDEGCGCVVDIMKAAIARAEPKA